jgi:hypothetical protein
VQGASFCSSKEEEVSHLEEEEAWTGRNCVGLERRYGVVLVLSSLICPLIYKEEVY